MTGSTGTYSDRSFCLTCGGRVTTIRDDEVEVTIGSLDQVPTDLTPEYELWVGRREKWLSPLSSATQFETDREDAGNEAEAKPHEEPESEPATENKPSV
jgi:hypothetical protein